MVSIALVVVESGSHWPAFVRGAAHDVVALSQASGEPCGIALERACERAERSYTAVRLAVLVCNADLDDESIHRRAFTASRLLKTVSRTKGGNVVLSAREGACAALRVGLVGLAATLSNTVLENWASVSVRIGDGIVWRVARPVAPPCGSYGTPGYDRVDESFAIARRDGRAEGVRPESGPGRLSSLPKTWRLAASGFDGSPKGRNPERKCLLS
jgi:hypothetical protein